MFLLLHLVSSSECTAEHRRCRYLSFFSFFFFFFLLYFFFCYVAMHDKCTVYDFIGCINRAAAVLSSAGQRRRTGSVSSPLRHRLRTVAVGTDFTDGQKADLITVRFPTSNIRTNLTWNHERPSPLHGHGKKL